MPPSLSVYEWRWGRWGPSRALCPVRSNAAFIAQAQGAVLLALMASVHSTLL